MFKHYLNIAFRNAMKNRVYALINIIGLAIGIACCIMILLYVQDELSFDQYHEKAERIYRLNEFIESGDVGERSASMPFPVAQALQTDFPENVESYVRFFNFQAPTLSMEYVPEEKAFNERRIFFVDSTLFDVFSFKLLSGDPSRALDGPNSVLITESTAYRYFETKNPDLVIGKVIRFQGAHDLMITGILEDTPRNSHFQFDFLISFSTLKPIYQQQGFQPFGGWYWNPCWTYLLLREGTQPEQLIAQFPDFVQKYYHPAIKDDVVQKLQPLTSIHLTSHLEYEIGPNGNEKNVYIFSGIAVFILLIACINFMNLATARSVKRAKEVGMRKALGGLKKQLVTQFLVESCLYSAVAVGLAIIIAELCLPGFNALADKAINPAFWLDPFIFLGLLLIGALVGIGSGLYPAFFLTRYDPVEVLKGTYLRAQGFDFRKALVVGQFTISMVLIVGTGVAIQQLNFLQNDSLGFNKEHVIMLPVLRSSMAQKYETFKDRILVNSQIESVTALEEILGAKSQGANYTFEGMNVSQLFPRLNIRHDFAKTFDIPVIAGRAYDETIETDDSLALVINEAMVRHLGWGSPQEAVGKRFQRNGEFRGKIVGVVKDFNFASKHQTIAPLVMDLNTHAGAFNLFIKYMAVRIRPNETQAAISAIESTWKEMIPEKAFEYFFLDTDLQKLYDAEARLTKVATIFSILAIIVACLGLFGLATYTAEQRKKEISIRKVLGSTVPQIILLLSGDFTKLILIACTLAAPLAWYMMDRWLEDFAYKIDIDVWLFILAGIIALFISWLTISYQSIRAARANPADVLRNE